MFNSSTTEKTTKRISDEVFADVERELAAGSAEVAEVQPAVAVPAAPAQDTLNLLAGIALPYVWATAVGVWVGGLLIMNSFIPVTQCIGIGLVTIGVLSSLVFAWRSRKPA